MLTKTDSTSVTIVSSVVKPKYVRFSPASALDAAFGTHDTHAVSL